MMDKYATCSIRYALYDVIGRTYSIIISYN